MIPELNARSTPDPARPGPTEARREELRALSVQFEAMFLAEMFRHAGAGKSTPGFDGGAGEQAFGSMLVNEQARLTAERGGVGLADAVYKAMLKREGVQE